MAQVVGKTWLLLAQQVFQAVAVQIARQILPLQMQPQAMVVVALSVVVVAPPSIEQHLLLEQILAALVAVVIFILAVLVQLAHKIQLVQAVAVQV
jgi:hypothetical protein